MSDVNLSFGLTFRIAAKDKAPARDVSVWMEDISKAKKQGLTLELPDNTKLGSLKQAEDFLEESFEGFEMPSTENLPESMAKVLDELNNGEVSFDKFMFHIPGTDDSEQFRFNLRVSVLFPGDGVKPDILPIGVSGATFGVNNLDKEEDDPELYQRLVAPAPTRSPSPEVAPPVVVEPAE